ncbi:MAG: DGQHR domain-containing protein [Rhodopseudomonas sp.]|uniref:DGQHR domain-containing protein n=1 Tax=Rhodopseudomonas sp. TaxID=1078 RepID=UPI0039E47FFB
MAKSKKKRRSKIDPRTRQADREKREHIREIRTIFTSAGFSRLSALSDKEFTFRGTTSDFDDVFLYENVIIFVEYTTLSDKISEHLKKKKVLYDKILEDKIQFIEFLCEKFPAFKEGLGSKYRSEHFRIALVYCSRSLVDIALKEDVSGVCYLDFHIAKYFKAIADRVKLSARYELFKFLGLPLSEIGESVVSPSTGASKSYKGSILPEGQSHFPKGFKVVSFYVDPGALLERCYVLRKDGWDEKGGLYQRMIGKTKIEAIRKYLRTQKRVFINNIIVTLPNSTRLIDSAGNTYDPKGVTRTEPVEIQLPTEYNSVGLIDGQHRVFSYYEGGAFESEFSVLRKQQNLLVTGIIYPPKMSSEEKTKFEAQLFLEINATQTNAKSDLKQAISLLLDPFSNESVAKNVVNRLNDGGSLADQFERFFFDKSKLKTTSVVSYGVRPLVKFSGEDSLFRVWSHPDKARLSEQNDAVLLQEYIKFCAKEINIFLGAIKERVAPERWTADKRQKDRLLTTTNINGFINCLRKIIQHDDPRSMQFYRSKLDGLERFVFKRYRSSQYARMGEDMYEQYFS